MAQSELIIVLTLICLVLYLLGSVVSSVEGCIRDSIVDGIKTLIKQGNTVLISDQAVEVQREAQLHCMFVGVVYLKRYLLNTKRKSTAFI